MEKDNNKKEKTLIEFYDPKKDIVRKFDFYIGIVIAILVFAMITMIVMTATLIIDSFHFNSATYQEYTRTIKRDINNQQYIIDSIDEIKNELEKLKK